MTDFDEQLRARLERLDAAIPAARLPSVSVVDEQQAESAQAGRTRRWPGRRVALVLAAAALLAIASVATAEQILSDDVNPPALEAALEDIFAQADCVTPADARTAIRARLDSLGFGDWAIEDRPGVDRARCVGAALLSTEDVVILLPAAGRELSEAIAGMGEELMRRCLGRDEAIRFVSSVLTNHGVTDFTVSADPWGPQGAHMDQMDAYRKHVAAGCVVYSLSGWDAGGRTVFYLWGPWP
jgi:hypothetical protein